MSEEIIPLIDFHVPSGVLILVLKYDFTNIKVFDKLGILVDLTGLEEKPQLFPDMAKQNVILENFDICRQFSRLVDDNIVVVLDRDYGPDNTELNKVSLDLCADANLILIETIIDTKKYIRIVKSRYGKIGLLDFDEFKLEATK